MFPLGTRRFLSHPRPFKAWQPFSVLALESSADDTCAAVVTSSRKILSNIVIKQHNLHEELGGIYPPIAINAHQRHMPIAIQRALRDAAIKAPDIDGIAFTRGPGIGGCLSVGLNAAKSLAAALDKPLVGVHHMQAHALTSLLAAPTQCALEYPFLTLLISGGHTLLLLATGPKSFRTLATTADQSIGRAFDKVSRLLGLAWTTHGPGAALEEFCAIEEQSETSMPPLPRPMPGHLAFSYSGLHSAVERYISQRGGIQNLDTHVKLALAREFQTAAVAQLEEKVGLGLKWCTKEGVDIRHIVVSGGVASNFFLRRRLQESIETASPSKPIAFVFPPPSLCTDNAVMIAWASMHRFLANDTDDYSIDLRPDWNIEELS